MRKKLLALLLATSTISSTLLPAQCVFAGTTGSTDVTIEESSAGNKPTPTPAPISTGLFREVNADDDDIKDLSAYPISHKDIFTSDPQISVAKNKTREKEINTTTEFINNNRSFSPLYDFTGFHYKPEISETAKSFIESQQSTYCQETKDCTFNAVTELTNKALIAQGLISKLNDHKQPNSIRNTRMSRAQISYNGLFITKDPLDGFHGDYSGTNGHYTSKQKQEIVKRLKNKETKDLRDTNDPNYVIRSLYSGMGPVKEKDIEDSRAKDLCNYGSINSSKSSNPEYPKNDLYTEDIYKNNYAHLTQKRTFPVNDKNTRDLMKAWIYHYGGVGISVHTPEDKENAYIYTHYNFTMNSFYKTAPLSTKKGHAMVIVGWDDTFPAAAFNTEDPRKKAHDGAWLVKNSWNPFEKNTTAVDENGNPRIQDIYEPEIYRDDPNSCFGEYTPFTYQRYFWLSYDSPSITELYGIAFEGPKYFDNIYQYDGYQENTINANSTKAANIFTIKTPDSKSASNKEQELKCVGFEITGKDTAWQHPVKYNVNIYRNISDKENPENENLVKESSTTGYCSAPGSYTIELPNRVLLKQGESFSVVVSLTDYATENNAKIAVEQNEDVKDPQKNHRGESFIYDSANKEWIDIAQMDKPKDKKDPSKDANYWPENVRIKAMTVNTDNSSTIDTTPVDPTPTVAPTSTPVVDCAKLSLKAKINGGLIGFECMIETSKDSPLTNQISYIKTTNPDNNSKKKNVITPFASLKRVNTKNGNTSVTLFYPIDPSDFEKTIQFEILDDKFEPVEMHLSDDSTNSGYMAYTTSMKEYLDKLKDAAISNNDTTTENFANALMIHMACSQNIYQTKAAEDINIDLSTLNDYGVASFTANRVKQGATDSTDQSINCVGISFNWKNTRDLSFIYYVTDPSSIKSIQIDGNDIAASSANSHQFEDINGQHCLIVSLSDIPIADYKKPHTITIENTYGNQVFTTASVYSYIYTTLKSKYTDQPTRSYAKSLALLKDTYDQLDKNDSRYKDFFIF